ncbi:MAG: hypothetical protein RIB98_17700 [Acidimicrobiales bacterium]
MRRILATVLFAVIGTTMAGTGIALAAEIEVTPAAPPEGDVELTIEVTDFTPDTPIYTVPCTVPAEGDELDPSTANCDLTEVVATTTDASGQAIMVVNWNIPAEGIAVFVGDEARTNQAFQIVTPGADVVEETEDVVEETEPDVEVLGTSVVQEDDLADTGPREIMILVMVATLLIGLGVALRSAAPVNDPA